MKRKLWILAAALCLLLSLAVFANAADIVDSGICGENLTWTLDSEGTLTISGMGDMDGYWYDYSDMIKSVVIEDGVTSINDHAFEASWNLTSVTIPDSVTSIGESAFSWCSRLTSIVIPDSVTSIGDRAFFNCSSLSGIWVSKENLNYSSDSFGVLFNKEKSELITAPGGISGSYVVPDSVTNIGDYAFYHRTNLTSVTIAGSVTGIGDSAFSWCSSLTSIVIPDSVTSIGEEAFYSCSSLTYVTIGDGVTGIGDSAFYDCTSLKEIIIPDSVTSIGESVFARCTSLAGIWADLANPNYSSDSFGVLYNKEKSELIYAPGAISVSYVVPDSVTSIGDYAFYWCTNLTTVTIPDSVTRIGESAFSWCSSLTTITISDGVTSIGYRAFYNCTNLIVVTIGENVTYIGDNAFRYCSSLTTVNIPSSVERLGHYAFGDCSSLKTIYFHGDAPYGPEDYGDNVVFPKVTATAYYPADNETWTEAFMRWYGGDITWVPYGQQEKFNLAGANLELANDITMYFYVNAADVADGYYMEIVKTNADGSKVTKKVDKSDWKTLGDMYYVGFNGMAAKEMADEISVTVYNAEGVQVSNTTVTSISAYALRALDNAAYASMHTMMADLLNYGAAAQTFFKYNTSNLANANMTETHQSYATKGFDMSKYTNDVVVGAGVVGANLSLETNILQNFYFDPAVVDNTMTAKVTYTNYKGVEKSVEISGDKFGTMAGYGYVIVEVAVLVPADVMSLVSVEIVDANGNVVASVSDSISSYAVRANTSSPNALYVELMEYCLSCESYFG